MSHPLGQGLAHHDFDEYVEFCNCLQMCPPKNTQDVNNLLLWIAALLLRSPKEILSVIFYLPHYEI